MPYYYYPFAVGGDTTPIPLPIQSSGSVSYQEGYGPDYELDLLTNPDAQPIGRLTFNQALNDITTDLQLYYQTGVPPFISTSDNQGTPFPYPIYARTRYMNVVYENQVDNNTATPGTDATWLVISGDSTGVLPGTMVDYAGPIAPAGYLLCDGSAVSRSTYGTLLSVISQTQTGTTTNTMNTVSGLTNATTTMYVEMPIESVNFPPATTIASIVDDNNITVSASATASGSVSIQFFNWGNGDGSTTFNIPDSRRQVMIGSGGTPYSGTTVGQVSGNVVGQSGGQEAHTQTTDELAAHAHDMQFYNNGTSGGLPADISSTNAGTLWPTVATGSNTPFNIMQPSTIVTKIIKT